MVINTCPELAQFTLILHTIFFQICKNKSLKTRKNPSKISWTLTQLTRLKHGNEHETCSTFFSFFPEFLFITQVGTKLWKRKENLTRFKKLILTQFKKPHTYIFPTYLLSREFLAHFNFFHKNRALGQFENNFYSTTSRNF